MTAGLADCVLVVVYHACLLSKNFDKSRRQTGGAATPQLAGTGVSTTVAATTGRVICGNKYDVLLLLPTVTVRLLDGPNVLSRIKVARPSPCPALPLALVRTPAGTRTGTSSD